MHAIIAPPQVPVEASIREHGAYIAPFQRVYHCFSVNASWWITGIDPGTRPRNLAVAPTPPDLLVTVTSLLLQFLTLLPHLGHAAAPGGEGDVQSHRAQALVLVHATTARARGRRRKRKWEIAVAPPPVTSPSPASRATPTFQSLCPSPRGWAYVSDRHRTASARTSSSAERRGRTSCPNVSMSLYGPSTSGRAFTPN